MSEVWMGRVEARPLEGADPQFDDVNDMVVLVYAFADSRAAFESVINAELDQEHIAVIRVEAAGPLHEMLDVDPDHLAEALETARFGSPTLSYHYVVGPEPDLDEDVELVRLASGGLGAVRFKFVGIDRWVFGFVVAVSEGWAVVQQINRDWVALGGYMAVPLDKVIDAETISGDRDWVPGALILRGEDPRDPLVPIDDHRAILAALQERYPLMGFVQWEGYSVARIETVGDESVGVVEVDMDGIWMDLCEYDYRDIKGIEFGSRYLEELASFISPYDAPLQ